MLAAGATTRVATVTPACVCVCRARIASLTRELQQLEGSGDAPMPDAAGEQQVPPQPQQPSQQAAGGGGVWM